MLIKSAVVRCDVVETAATVINISKGNLCNHNPRGKILPFGNLTFYFSNSIDFVKNKSPFIHCNSDIEEPSKNTLIHFDIINYSAKSCFT